MNVNYIVKTSVEIAQLSQGEKFTRGTGILRRDHVAELKLNRIHMNHKLLPTVADCIMHFMLLGVISPMCTFTVLQILAHN